MIDNDPILFAIPFFTILVLIELWINYKEKLELYEFKDSVASISMGLGSLVVDLVTKTLAFAGYWYLFQFRIFDIGWQWWAWVLLFFADDFTFYWHHRLCHEVRILWASHVNHHSSQFFNLSTALRQSWGEQTFKFIWWIWLPLLGFHPVMIMIMMSISLIYQFWVHTEMIRKMGPFEFVFNTPSHHRVHHASNIKYLDRNHAGILIIWDRLFGTFAEEDNEAPIYGITTNIDTYNPLKIATHEMVALWNDVRAAKSWKTKINYMIKPPGWSPSGPNQTAEFLRKQWQLKQTQNKNKNKKEAVS